MLFAVIPSVPFLDSALDLASLSLLTLLLLLSFLSFFFILHLRLKSRIAPHLEGFNSLWTVKLLLVASVTLWALSQDLRVPFFRRRYLYPQPSFSPIQEADLCKLHTVLSLGLFEPAFLITLLFLVNVSVKKQNPRPFWVVTSVLGTCLPLALVQYFFTYYSPAESRVPAYFFRSSVITKDSFGNETVLCTNPLVGTIIFGIFALTYCLCFLLSCWKVVSLVINKGLRTRIYGLTLGILIPLPVQIMLLVASAFLAPQKMVFGGISIGLIIAPMVCAAAGEGVLILKPISDALAVGDNICQWRPIRQVDIKKSMELVIRP